MGESKLDDGLILKLRVLVYAAEVYAVAFILSAGLFVVGVGMNPLYILVVSVLIVYLLETRVDWSAWSRRARAAVDGWT